MLGNGGDNEKTIKYVISFIDTFAITIDTSYKDGQVISKSNSLDEGYKYVTEDELSVMRSNTDNSINPSADELVKSKTIIVTYESHSSIRDSYYYREHFEKEKRWNSGYLPLIRTERTSSGWEATFSGKIFPYVE